MENAADRGKAQEPWIRTRHRIISILLYPVIWLIVFLRYGVRPERFRGPEKGPYLILYNHQTPLDLFFVGLSFPGAVYYLATEDIFSNGWTSVLLRWLTAPIPIRKEVLDIAAMRIMMQVAGEGGTIAIAPEGNRTYSGAYASNHRVSREKTGPAGGSVPDRRRIRRRAPLEQYRAPRPDARIPFPGDPAGRILFHDQ